jgi:phenylacetic acid degradation operon negative regulatory protein
MKLLKKKILFALISDAESAYHPYKYLYFRTSEYSPASVRDAVNELSVAGAVDKIKRNQRVGLRLTGFGRELFLKNNALMAPKQPWTKRWLVLIVNRIGIDLRALQSELNKLGFKRSTRGIYLTPWPVASQTRDVIVKNKWFNQVFIIESRRLINADDWQLARSLWHLEELEEQYDRFITMADRLLRLSRPNLILLQQAKFGFKAIFDAYYKLICLDPGLPKALLPPEWRGEEAKSLYYRLVELAKTAKI